MRTRPTIWPFRSRIGAPQKAFGKARESSIIFGPGPISTSRRRVPSAAESAPVSFCPTANSRSPSLSSPVLPIGLGTSLPFTLSTATSEALSTATRPSIFNSFPLSVTALTSKALLTRW